MMRMHVMMYVNVMFLAGENKSRITAGEKIEFFASVGDSE